MEKKSIGSFIAALRKSSGMTQRGLAEKLMVSDKTVSHWERNESVPDLTLIPVIAEIFGVTCDELLRGERIKHASEESLEKTEKQIKHLLGRSRTKFKTRSLISLGLSISGLFAAMICNFGFNRGYLGFLIGCIFWAAAVICESIFYSLALSAVSGDDFDGIELNDYKIYAVRLAGKIISAAIIMLGASLPFFIIPPDAFWGVTAETWLLTGLLFAAAASLICLFIVYAVNISLIKKCVYALEKEKDIKRHKNNGLKVRCTAVVAAILLVMFTAQAAFNSALGADAFAAGTTFYNFEDFKAYMETEKEGEYFGDTAPRHAEIVPQYTDVFIKGQLPKYFDEFGNPAAKEQALTEYIYDNEGNVLYQYVHLNREVTFTKYEGGGTDAFSITAWTSRQLASGQSVRNFINTSFLILYIIVAGIGFIVYFKKRAKKAMI